MLDDASRGGGGGGEGEDHVTASSRWIACVCVVCGVRCVVVFGGLVLCVAWCIVVPPVCWVCLLLSPIVIIVALFCFIVRVGVFLVLFRYVWSRGGGGKGG